MSNKDMVNSPPHYNQFSQEVIETINEWTQAYSGNVGYMIGNTLKYIARAPYKWDTLEDVSKAQYYLNRAVEELKKEQTE